MKRLTYIKQICIAVMLLGMGSCNTLDPVPTGEFTDANFWTSPENAELIVNMAYNQMYAADKMWNDEALSDNVFEGRGNTGQRIIRNGIADPSLGLFDTEWEWAYGGIKTCHIFLQFIDIVPGMAEELKERRKAEIRFIRAHLYFRLVNFYGEVPFFTSDVSLEESQSASRTSKAQILNFIHDELDEIIPLLPNRNQLSVDERGRITSGAAVAFQARAYLYESNWEKVVEYCDKLINQGGTFGNYSLFSSYTGLFEATNEYNEEVILDYGYVPSLKFWSKYYDAAPLSAGARLNDYAPLQELVDSYLTTNGLTIWDDPAYNENNPYVNRDPRLAATVVFHGGQWRNFDGTTSTIYIRPGTGGNDRERLDVYQGAGANSTSTGYYMRKYYDQTAVTNYQSGLNIIMYRYADVLLMYAEALNELNRMDENTWNQTIRAIRDRAGFVNPAAFSFPSVATQAQLREIIRNERRSELALEGLRYYDIVRWKAGKQYLDGVVHGAKFANNGTSYIQLDSRRFDENRDYLWSVPRAEMDINNNLRPNNPGYGN